MGVGGEIWKWDGERSGEKREEGSVKGRGGVRIVGVGGVQVGEVGASGGNEDEGGGG